MTAGPRAKRSQPIVTDYMARIARGELGQGDLLPTEAELTEHYGVSRSAVREAVQTLVAKGFLEVRQGSGSRIAPRERWNELDPDFLLSGLGDSIFRSLIEARETIEPAMAALAALHARREHLERLRALIADQQSIGGIDADRHADIDVAFHHAIALASANPVFVSIHSSLLKLGRAQRAALATVPGAVERALTWHTHVLTAIEACDPGAARDSMRMHMRQVRAELDLIESDVEVVATANRSEVEWRRIG